MVQKVVRVGIYSDESAVAVRESDVNVMKLEGKKEKKNTELIMMTPV